jgi:hypothetical protein
MSSIRSREVAWAQRPGVGCLEDALKALDFGNSLLGIHAVSISDMSKAIVKQSNRPVLHAVPEKTSCLQRKLAPTTSLPPRHLRRPK